MTSNEQTFAIRWELVAQEVIRRIVAAVQPQRILVFGSGARGKISKDSDLDIYEAM